jgi:hypothetical protein
MVSPRFVAHETHAVRREWGEPAAEVGKQTPLDKETINAL